MNNLVGFECTKCGDCCKGFSEDFGVILFPFEIKPLATNLTISEDEFKAKFCTSKNTEVDGKKIDLFYLRYDKEGMCLFLKNNACSIHSFKPLQCQKGPFNFFWDGEMKFECMKKTYLPENWSTELEDIELVKLMMLSSEI